MDNIGDSATPKVSKKKRWNLDFPIPHSIALPGVRIKVVTRDPSVHAVAANNHGTWNYDLDVDKAIIVLDGTAAIQQQRYSLLHELLHAVHELLDVGISEYPEHVQPTKAQKPSTQSAG